MTRCCDPRGCDEFFGDKFARRVAKRYRKRGLDKTSRRIVAFLERAGVQEATVLEIATDAHQGLVWQVEGLTR